MKTSIDLRAGLGLLGLVGLLAWSQASPTFATAPAPAPVSPFTPLTAGPTPINSFATAIDAPGTYCLTQNLYAMPGDPGLKVTSDNVIIDLGGFTLYGAGPGEEASGITDSFVKNVTIRNGTVENWGRFGIQIGSHSKVHDVFVRDCWRGVQVGAFSVVENCSFVDNEEQDINASNQSRIRDCQVEAPVTPQGEFSPARVFVANRCIVERVVVFGGSNAFGTVDDSRFVHCQAIGFDEVGFSASDHGYFDHCLARASTLIAKAGIRSGGRTQVTNCVIEYQVEIGLELGEFCTVADTSVERAAVVGIQCGRGSRIVDSTVTECNQARGADGAGILAEANTWIQGTVAAANYAPGIRFVGEGGIVEHCSAFDNEGDGIVLLGSSLAKDNWVVNNLGTGLRVTGDRLRIEDNTVDANDQGVVVAGRKSLILGNRAADNSRTDFTIQHGNPFGKIIDIGYSIVTSFPQANYETP